MLAHIRSCAIVGLHASEVVVEVDIASKALPSFAIVGLPDKAVEESKERVRSAIKNSGGEFPAKKITVNLAPADVPKNGPFYDLPIAIGILAASGQIPNPDTDALFLGELSLDGSLRRANGVLALSLFAKKDKIRNVYIPRSNTQEAAVVEGICVIPVSTLIELFGHLSDIHKIEPARYVSLENQVPPSDIGFDMADIQGQDQVKRACEIAASGGHNMFMHGPPGAGKTLLARTLPSILPDMTEEEILEVTNVYSITGNLTENKPIVFVRPFRSPHHTTSRVGLIGGGKHILPGEISLAHRGILFLDEFPEFPRHVLEALRQPMEDGFVTISRAQGSLTYPSKFMLLAAANPCPCGNYGSDKKLCTCLPSQILRYQKRVSGPILDRIDIHVSVPAVPVGILARPTHPAESSETIRKRVQNARRIQRKRLREWGVFSNAEMNSKVTKIVCEMSQETRSFLTSASDKLNLTARSYYRILKIARTVADLESDDTIATHHIAEALQYRPKN